MTTPHTCFSFFLGEGGRGEKGEIGGEWQVVVNVGGASASE